MAKAAMSSQELTAKAQAGAMKAQQAALAHPNPSPSPNPSPNL
jgi:hypothetical protein